MKEKKMIVYIAGPVTGVERYWEAFEKADDDLTAKGFTVLNPARLPATLDNEKAMPICMAMIEAADAVVLLPGWEKSNGATLEKLYAEKIGKAVKTMPEFLDLLNLCKEFAKLMKDAIEKAVKNP